MRLSLGFVKKRPKFSCFGSIFDANNFAKPVIFWNRNQLENQNYQDLEGDSDKIEKIHASYQNRDIVKKMKITESNEMLREEVREDSERFQNVF